MKKTLSTESPASVSNSSIPALPQSRRAFVKRILAAGAAANVPLLAQAGIAPGPYQGPGPDIIPNGGGSGGWNNGFRAMQAYNVRVQSAQAELQRGVKLHPDNGDEQRYPNKIGSFSKGLPHNNFGEVDLGAYQLLLQALKSGNPSDFEKIPLGCPDVAHRFKLVDPQAGLAFDLEGADSHALYMPPAPTFGSAEENAELAELYWMALTRDVPFSEYNTNPLTQQAAADLSLLGSAFKGPRDVSGQVTPGTLFRDNLPGCLSGPCQSQFRWLACPFGFNSVDQKMQTILPGQDFITNFVDWLNIENGCYPAEAAQFDPTMRYIRCGRDAARWVEMDSINQAAFIAMLILVFPLGTDGSGNPMYAPPNPGNPYLYSQNQTALGTFGLPHVASIVPEVTTRALKAVWYQKWFVHRRLRPEEYAARVHLTLTGVKSYPIGQPTLLQSSSVSQIYNKFGSYLLPQVFPEGCPLHPSYGQGHGVAVGAGVTILKAFFDETFVIPFPVQPSLDGLTLEPYTDSDAGQMTVGGELNKLASNITQSRNIAGVHWRSDGVEALKLGEAVAISILQDQRATYNENFAGFTFTKFDGTRITV